MVKTIFPVSEMDGTGSFCAAALFTRRAKRCAARHGVKPLRQQTRAWAGTLLGLLMLTWLASSSFAASTYYVSPSGSSSNTGLSTSSPWSLSYALANAGAGSTIILMSGTYSGEVDIPQSYLTLKSQVKWGARLVNSSGVGICTWPAGTVHDVTIDGLAVSNSRQGGIWLYGANCTVRNCWVSHAGTGNAGAQDGSGIVSHAQPNTLIERNLLEYNGSTPGYDHGIYVGGTNVIVRGNVCRHNLAFGIQIYSSGTPMDKCQIYDNLIYGNNTGGGTVGDGLTVYYSGSGVNSVYGNTIISSGSYCCQFHGGTLLLTNNILLSAGSGVFAYSPVTVLADYNLASSTLSTPGPHDRITGTPGFVNPGNGLYWLGGSSPARSAAWAAVFGAVDFFGNSQSTVADIGGVQYNSAYASDTRVLDPSPSGGADYWLPLAGGGGSGTPAIALTPQSQSFGSLAVGTFADQTFTVLNTGSASLTGSASAAAPFAVVSGAAYSLSPGQSQSVTVRYAPTTAGSASQSVLFTGGTGTNATVSGSATNSPSAPSGVFAFQASAGVLTAPFLLTNGYVCQTVDTENANGGKAVFGFTTSTAGVYLVSAVVNAANTSANSLYVNIDNPPTDPYTIWDIPVTSGFQSRTVSWRGNGIGEADQFAPKAFALPAGAHSLIVMGREPNVQLQSIQIQPASLTPPPPPQSLTPVATP